MKRHNPDRPRGPIPLHPDLAARYGLPTPAVTPPRPGAWPPGPWVRRATLQRLARRLKVWPW